MRTIDACLLTGAAASCLAISILAQSTVPNSAGQTEVRVQDGGVRQRLESIFIPPMSNSPFTCTLHTEWGRITPEGGTITLVNARKIARESSGRIYQERWALIPKNSQVEPQMSFIQIADPNNHTLYSCAISLKTCSVTTYEGTVSKLYKPADAEPGTRPNGGGSVTRESLGNGFTEGVATVGTRITQNFNAWVMGNDQPFSSTREYWFAPTLGFNLISKISDPRFGNQTFTVTDLAIGEPDPALFELPKGFQMEDARTPPQTGK